MTLKIPVEKTEVLCASDEDNWAGVIVRVATWRKVMAVVRAADGWVFGDASGEQLAKPAKELREHLAKLK